MPILRICSGLSRSINKWISNEGYLIRLGGNLLMPLAHGRILSLITWIELMLEMLEKLPLDIDNVVKATQEH